MRWISLALLLSLAACTTAESDRANRNVLAAYRTRIDFHPLSRADMLKSVQFEKHVLEENTRKLRNEFEAVQAERQLKYDVASREFPECRRQRHCLSSLSRGSVEVFERYQKAFRPVLELDAKLVDLKATLDGWDRRYSLRERALFNRFLVHELLQVAKMNNHIQQILPHSLEAYDSSDQLARRVLKVNDPGFTPTIRGDFDLRMLGHALDEAAVIATLDVWLRPDPNFPEAPTRYLITMLVNSYHSDPMHYDRGFLHYWSKRLAEPTQLQLKKDVYCGVYGVAGPILAPKLDPSKVKPCAQARAMLQSVNHTRYQDRLSPEHWILPIAYFEMKEPK